MLCSYIRKVQQTIIINVSYISDGIISVQDYEVACGIKPLTHEPGNTNLVMGLISGIILSLLLTYIGKNINETTIVMMFVVVLISYYVFLHT